MSAAEAIAHVDEILTVYEGEERESQIMVPVIETMMKNMSTYVDEGERLKSIIKAFIEDFEKEEEESEEIERKCRIDEEIMQIKTESQRAKRIDEELIGQLNDTNSKCAMLQREIDELKAKHRDTLQSLRRGDLYNEVAQIRWQKDSETPDLIRGTVVNKSGVKPFSLDQKQQSRHSICNYVWNLMEADW